MVVKTEKNPRCLRLEILAGRKVFEEFSKRKNVANKKEAEENWKSHLLGRNKRPSRKILRLAG
jgi:hypothetical protein